MSPQARRSKLCLGFGLVLLVLLGETVVAHQRMPHPASPVLWTLLGAGALLCFVLAAWFHVRARRGPQ